MKRKSTYLLGSLMSIFMVSALSGCASEESEKVVLRVLNSADYIYEVPDEFDEDASYNQYLSEEEDMMDQFVTYMAEQGVEVSYVYDTFDTNETMYNELMTGKSSYDIIVTSDYMVQKLITNDLIQPLYKQSYEESDELESIRNNVSNYLWDIFDNIHPKDKVTNEYIEDKVISQYSVPYMWGSVGVMYNPDFYEDLETEEVIDLFSSWEGLYSESANNSFSIKDSVRDVYVVSVIHALYESDIKPLEEKLQKGEIDETTFNKELNKIFNRCDDETLELIKEDMLALKANSFGFEVDSGKTDMVEGKIGANLAWSGDATWAIEEAETDYDTELYFSIPDEGSNIWFDAFCVPTVSENLELATKFIEFMCQPQNAIQNMWSVGYTTAVSSSEVLDYFYECYDVRVEVGEESEEEFEEYDIRYFFDGSIEKLDDAILHAYPEVTNRTLKAQMPEQDDLAHLCVMDDFGLQNEAVLNMWESVRTNPLPIWALIILLVELAIAFALIGYFGGKKAIKAKMRKEHKKSLGKQAKNYLLTSINNDIISLAGSVAKWQGN